ncbi:glycosyltransferase family 2 protein [Gorillibacterium sp. sgz5001074]|uniref:glycosyltransferase family 2 protein n=1 Tax=Gorillibacterium sp. sgz5001074 TaxID=3446695 RepID=UPI003F6638F0
MSTSLVIIPAYNEESSIAEVVQGIRRQHLDLDILVVNDGSTDRTADVAQAEGVLVISHPTNLGYGAAVQTGYKFADSRQYPYVIQFDADGQHDPSTLHKLTKAIEEGDSDIVIGSRFLNGSDIEMKVGLLKRMTASFFRWIIRVLTGVRITDTTSGLRAVRRKAYAYYSVRNRFPQEYPDADFLIQLLYRNYKITEVQANMRDRSYGKSVQHGGVKPVIYMMRMVLNIFIVLLQHKILLRVKKNA